MRTVYRHLDKVTRAYSRATRGVAGNRFKIPASWRAEQRCELVEAGLPTHLVAQLTAGDAIVKRATAKQVRP
jgi:hypothetical protein